MFKNAQEEINFLLFNLDRLTPFTDREIRIGMMCYGIGRAEREMQIMKHRSLPDERRKRAVQEEKKQN